MSVQPKTFDAIIYLSRAATSEYYSREENGVWGSFSKIMWLSEDPEGFKDDYCFEVHLKDRKTGKDLYENEDFHSSLEKIGHYVKYNWIPASLLVGKKTGDVLKLKDKSVVLNLTCVDFNFLHHTLKMARKNLPSESGDNPEKQAILSKRLDELQALVTEHYGECKSEISKEDIELINGPKPETNYCDELVASLKKVLLAIAQFFVRLFTCNWSEKTCLDDKSDEGKMFQIQF